MSSDGKIQLIYEGKFNGLCNYIESSIKRNKYRLAKEGILFVGVVSKKDGEIYKADYTQPRIRPTKFTNKQEDWLTAYRLSYMLQSIMEAKDEDYCKVGVVIHSII